MREPSRLNCAAVGYQPVGMNPVDLAARRVAHVHDGDGVVVGVGDEQRPAVGREAQAVRRRAGRRVREERHRDLLLRRLRGDIDDPDAVRVRAGHEQTRAVLREDHGVRVFADGNLAALLERRRVEGQDLRAAPDRHEHRLAVRRHQAGVGLGADVDGSAHQARLDVEHRQRLAEDVDRVDEPAVGRDGDAADEALLDRLRPVDAGHRLLRVAPERVDGAGGELARRPVELVHRRLARAGREDAAAVRVPRQAEPGVVHVRLRRDVAALEVDDGERRLGVAVVGDDQVVAVRRLDHGERQVADLHVAAGGLDLPAVRQQRHAVAEAAGPGGRRRCEAGDGCRRRQRRR